MKMTLEVDKFFKKEEEELTITTIEEAVEISMNQEEEEAISVADLFTGEEMEIMSLEVEEAFKEEEEISPEAAEVDMNIKEEEEMNLEVVEKLVYTTHPIMEEEEASELKMKILKNLGEFIKMPTITNKIISNRDLILTKEEEECQEMIAIMKVKEDNITKKRKLLDLEVGA
jgi:hypothetical protein